MESEKGTHSLHVWESYKFQQMREGLGIRFRKTYTYGRMNHQIKYK
jgi:hypothetical protein